MKIAYIVPSLINQGPIIVVKNIVDYLSVLGCEIKVYYFDDLPAMLFSCPTERISMNTSIDFDYYDVIHSHCIRPDIYVYLWRKKIKKAKIISTLHQDTYRSFCYKYNSFVSFLLTRFYCCVHSHFSSVICISNQLKSIYEKHIDAPMVTIYNGCYVNIDDPIDTDIQEKILKLRDKYKILGTYSFVTRQKGLNQVIQSLVYLHDYAFVIIGKGPDIELLKELSSQIGVSDRVVFISYQKNPCIYLPYFDVYMMPSYSEGFGMAMVEAALANRAIVCSNIPTFHELFDNNEASFFELDNIPSLVEAISIAYSRRDYFGRMAKAKAISKFTSSVMAQKYLDFYKKITI